MGIKINKGVIIGVVSGLAAFIIFLILMYSSSDFDQNLINQVENGVPAEKLIPQIDKETQKMKESAQKRYRAAILSHNWKKGYLISSNEYSDHTISFNEEMKNISLYDEIRKKYAKREITKAQFNQEIIIIKEYFNVIY